mgnify:CR=1 FL=1
MPNFIVKAQWISDSNGKVKKHTELYLVDAVSVTDAESATVAEFGQDVSEIVAAI